MKFDLAAMANRAGTRRKVITFRPILTTQAQAISLARISHQMLAPWYGARQRIEDAYARELARVLQTDGIDDLTSLLEEIGDEVQRLVIALTPDLRSFALGMEAWHRRKWGDTVLAGANVDLQYQLGPQDSAETVGAFLERNTALVRDVSAQAQGRISDAVFRGLQQRVPTRQVGKEIADATGFARARANRIASHQSVALSGALDDQRQREAGLDFWRYKHSGKLHPRSWHRARDGKLYERDTRREVEFIDGKKVYGDDIIEAGDGPTEPPFCGCNRQAVLLLDGEVLG